MLRKAEQKALKEKNLATFTGGLEAHALGHSTVWPFPVGPHPLDHESPEGSTLSSSPRPWSTPGMWVTEGSQEWPDTQTLGLHGCAGHLPPLTKASLWGLFRD